MAKTQEIPSRDLGFDLKTPCADCPFKRTVPIHHGVAGDLIGIWGKIEQGRFAHSCHKTDPRSDGYVESYSGQKIQHCAGSILMMKGMGSSGVQDHWATKGVAKKIGRLAPHPDVFKNLTEMFLHYAEHLKKSEMDSIVE